MGLEAGRALEGKRWRARLRGNPRRVVRLKRVLEGWKDPGGQEVACRAQRQSAQGREAAWEAGRALEGRRWLAGLKGNPRRVVRLKRGLGGWKDPGGQEVAGRAQR